MVTRMAEQEPLVIEALGSFPPASCNLSQCSLMQILGLIHHIVSSSYSNLCISVSYILTFSRKSSLINPTYPIFTPPPRISGFRIFKCLKAFSCRNYSAPQGYKSPVYLHMPDSQRCIQLVLRKYGPTQESSGLSQNEALCTLHKNC